MCTSLNKMFSNYNIYLILNKSNKNELEIINDIKILICIKAKQLNIIYFGHWQQ